MSQAIITAGLSSVPTLAAATSGVEAIQHIQTRWFSLRPVSLVLLASGLVSIVAVFAMSKMSDSVLDSNMRAQAAAAMVPPAEYYQLIAMMPFEGDEATAATAMSN